MKLEPLGHCPYSDVACTTLFLPVVFSRVGFDLISQEKGSFSALPYVRFFLCNSQLEVFFYEGFHLLPDSLCISIRTNDTNAVIIGVPAVEKSLVSSVKGITAWNLL